MGLKAMLLYPVNNKYLDELKEPQVLQKKNIPEKK